MFSFIRCSFLLLFLSMTDVVSATPYDVLDIQVREKSVDAVQAKAEAMDRAYWQAFETISKRLTSVRYHQRLPDPSSVPVGRFVRGVHIQDEVMTTNCYSARFGVYFDAGKIRSALRRWRVPIRTSQAPVRFLVTAYQESDELDVSEKNCVFQAWDSLDIRNSVTPLDLLPDQGVLSVSEIEDLLENAKDVPLEIREKFGVMNLLFSACNLDSGRGAVRCRIVDGAGIFFVEEIPLGEEAMFRDRVRAAIDHGVALLLVRLEEWWRRGGA